jgi:Neuraminidase (sialidase)
VLLDVFVEGSSLPGTPHPPPLPVKIRVSRSTDQGQTWSAPIDATQFTYTNAVDPGTGSQLRFFGQDITAAAAGNALYVAWFEAHTEFSSILVARSEDAGLHWRAPQVVVRETAEAFLPTLAVAGDGTVGLLWYDFRHFAPKSSTLTTDVWFSSSRDRGLHWTERHVAGAFDLRSAPAVRFGPFLGDYMGLSGLSDGFAAVFIQAKPQSRNGQTDVFFSHVRT